MHKRPREAAWVGDCTRDREREGEMKRASGNHREKSTSGCERRSEFRGSRGPFPGRVRGRGRASLAMAFRPRRLARREPRPNCRVPQQPSPPVSSRLLYSRSISSLDTFHRFISEGSPRVPFFLQLSSFNSGTF